MHVGPRGHRPARTATGRVLTMSTLCGGQASEGNRTLITSLGSSGNNHYTTLAYGTEADQLIASAFALKCSVTFRLLSRIHKLLDQGILPAAQHQCRADRYPVRNPNLPAGMDHLQNLFRCAFRGHHFQRKTHRNRVLR